MTYDHITSDLDTWTVTVDEEGILTLPDELLNRMQWKEGDILDWQDNPDGTITLTKSPNQTIPADEFDD